MLWSQALSRGVAPARLTARRLSFAEVPLGADPLSLCIDFIVSLLSCILTEQPMTGIDSAQTIAGYLRQSLAGGMRQSAMSEGTAIGRNESRRGEEAETAVPS